MEMRVRAKEAEKLGLLMVICLINYMIFVLSSEEVRRDRGGLVWFGESEPRAREYDDYRSQWLVLVGLSLTSRAANPNFGTSQWALPTWYPLDRIWILSISKIKGTGSFTSLSMSHASESELSTPCFSIFFSFFS